MRDRVCPIGDCTATVRFEEPVVDVTPRYRLHDLGNVDEFAVCPDCDAEVAGFYEEDEDDGTVELILDIDEDGDGERDADVDAESDEEVPDGEEVRDAADDGDDGDGSAGSEFDAYTDDFDDPEDVLADADVGASIDPDDEDDYEPVFGTGK